MTGPQRRVLAAFAAVLMVSGVLVPMTSAGAVGASSAVSASVTLPADIGINQESAVQDYEDHGYTNRTVEVPNMAVAIGEDRDQIGLDIARNPADSGVRNDFVRVSHREDIHRTVRIPVSGDYWDPFPREELESLSSGHTASMEPVSIDGERYTMITVTFDGSGSAVFPIPEDAKVAYSYAERAENVSSGVFGVDLGLTKSPWSYMNESVLDGEDITARIETNSTEDLMVEYNAGTASDPVWLKVPDKPKDGVPVYTMQKSGVENSVYVVSRTSEPVQVRFKENGGVRDDVGAMKRDAEHILSSVTEDVGISLPDISVFGSDDEN